MYKIMTAGPTRISENVRTAMAQEPMNPDFDPAFYDLYKETCELLSKALNTKNEAYILSGEGILGLEAACASLTEPGDRVLVIDNGIFGKGFADFVKIYGGIPVLYTKDYREPIDINELKAYLEKDHDFKYATVVHCDTPSGMLNDVENISKLLAEYHILTVCDSVSGMFGNPLDLSNASIDILCGGSQKALSAATGLTMLWVSDKAFKSMESRKSPIASFYANILNFRGYYEKKWLPYSMPVNDIYGLRVALDNYFDNPDILERHARIASAVRDTISAAGLSLYGNAGYSDTVTVIEVPKGITDKEIIAELLEDHNIMISGCFDVLAGKAVRIGHLGENCKAAFVAETLEALQTVFSNHGIKLAVDMKSKFLELLN